MRVALAAALLLAVLPPAYGAEIFVAPGGKGGGASKEDALGDLAKALAQAKPGDTVLLLPGRYPGRLDLNGIKGEPGKPIVLRSSEPHKALIDLSGNEKNKFKIVGAEHLTLEGLDIGGSPSVGLKVDDSKFVRVLDCRLHDNILEGVFFMRCEDMELARCEIFKNGDLKGKENNIDGLMSRFVKRGHYHHNNVYENSSAGFDVAATTVSVIECNFIHHNGANFNGPGLKLLHEGPSVQEGFCHGTVVRNNIFLDNESCGVFFSSGSGEGGKLAAVHNTIIARRVAQHGGLRFDAGFGGHQAPHLPGANQYFKNNIVYVVQPKEGVPKDWEYNACVQWKPGQAEGFSKQFVDWNIYWHNRPERFACEEKGKPMDFEGWKKLSGLDAHSYFAEQVFANLAGDSAEVARLAAGSPAIDAGTDLGEWKVETDYFGHARKDGKPDAGAVEFEK